MGGVPTRRPRRGFSRSGPGDRARPQLSDRPRPPGDRAGTTGQLARGHAVGPALVAYVNLAADRRQEAIEFLEKTRTLAPEVLPARLGLAALYEQDGARTKARAEVAEILRIRPDLTVEAALELLPMVGRDELVAYPGLLRAAGLPSR